MEPLNRQHYEEWFMSYLDGQLSDEQLEMLLDFLELNPDLKEELRGISGITLTPTQEVFAGKSSLMKNNADIPGISTIDRLCIARMEHDLSPEEARQFDEQLSHDATLQTNYAAFQHTRLKPQHAPACPDKRGLQKKTVMLSPWWIAAVSTAAVVLMGWFLWPHTPESQNIGIAFVESPSATNQPAKVNHQPSIPQQARENTQMAYAATHTPKQNHRPISVNNLTQSGVATSGLNTHDQKASRDFTPMKALRERDLMVEPSTFIAQNDKLSGSSFSYPMLRIPDPTDDALTLPQFALRLFREKVLGQKRELVRETQFSVWEVAGAGVDKINALTGSKMELNRTYDAKGDILAVSFNSRLFDLESPVRSGNK